MVLSGRPIKEIYGKLNGRLEFYIFFQVCVRCRPLNKKEKNANARVITNMIESTGEINIGHKTYNFDKVFGPKSDQMSVYR